MAITFVLIVIKYLKPVFMKKNILSVIFAIAFFQIQSNTQFTRYIITFKDKNTTPFSLSNPLQYLTAKAIARRTKYNIAIDSADLPITPRYIDSIKMAGTVTVLNSSKWLNQVAIQTNDATALAKINSLPFVQSVNPIAARHSRVRKENIEDITTAPFITSPQNISADFYNYGLSYNQVHLHNGEFLHNRGFKGQGMQMAVLDAGFFNYLTLPTFDSARINGQILGTWDFVTGNASVNEDHQHGMQCLSTIAANIPGTFVGTAPKTSFYLYRTEEAATEYPIEEQNWAAAAERADSLGVDVCSVSLGYYTFDNATFNHTYANMDGNTTIIARAADIAAKKGMLIVVAAGNEGNSSWHYIISPADADSVMAVGAVNVNGVVGSFSSYGPSSDGQIKPSVAAVGVSAVVANAVTGLPNFSNGTSFACPNMAGLSTCLWQAFPEVNNMAIINTLQKAANNTNTPNDRIGYGIPDMKKAFVLLIKQLFTQQITVSNCKAKIDWAVKTDSAITLQIEKKLPSETNYTTINVLNSSGAFTLKNFSFEDDLSNVNSTSINYRIKMNIAADTSFYFDVVTVNFSPKPNLGTDITLTNCADSSVNLTTLFANQGATNLWTLNGSTVVNTLAVKIAGNYQLISNSNSGCADTAVANINFIAKPNLGIDKTVEKCADSIYNLTSLFNTSGLTTTWKFGGNNITNAAAATQQGVYQLIAINSSGCADTALATLNNNSLLCPSPSISPNPAIDILKIKVLAKDAASKVEIVMYNSKGQRVFNSIQQQAQGAQTYTIPVKNFAAGIYTVIVFKEGIKYMVKKVVVVRGI